MNPYDSTSPTRGAATQATVNRFLGKRYAIGSRDCAQMTIYHLGQFGISLPDGWSEGYSTARGALSALKRIGQGSMADALDSIGLRRAAPNERAIGDIVALPCDDRCGALAIAVNGGALLGYHENTNVACLFLPVTMIAAWQPFLQRDEALA